MSRIVIRRKRCKECGGHLWRVMCGGIIEYKHNPNAIIDRCGS